MTAEDLRRLELEDNPPFARLREEAGATGVAWPVDASEAPFMPTRPDVTETSTMHSTSDPTPRAQARNLPRPLDAAAA